MLGGAPVLNSMIFGTVMLSGLAHGTQTSPNGSVPTGSQAVPIATQPPVAGQQPSGCPPGQQSCPPAGAAAPVQQNLGQKAEALVGDATEVAKGALADASDMAGNAWAKAQNIFGNFLGSKQETVHAASQQPMPQKQIVQHVTTTATNSQTAGQPTVQGNPLSRMLQKPVAPVPTTKQADAELAQFMQGMNGGNTVTKTVTRHHHSNAWPSAHQTLAQKTVNGQIHQKINPMNNLFQRIQQMGGNVAQHANNFGNGAMQTFHQTVTSSTKPVQPVYQPSQTVVETKTVTKTENVHTPAPVSPATETVAEVIVQEQTPVQA